MSSKYHSNLKSTYICLIIIWFYENLDMEILIKCSRIIYYIIITCTQNYQDYCSVNQCRTCTHYYIVLLYVSMSNLWCIIKSAISHSLHHLLHEVWLMRSRCFYLNVLIHLVVTDVPCLSLWWAKPTQEHEVRDFSDVSSSALRPQPPASTSSPSLLTTTSVHLH